MSRKIVSEMMLTLLLIGMLTFAFSVQPAKTELGTVQVQDYYPTIQEIDNNVNTSEKIESDNTLVCVHPQNITASLGQTFTISICIFNVTNLYGLDIKFSWDPALLEYVDHTATIPVETYPGGVLHGPILPIADIVRAATGTYHIAKVSMLPAQSFNGSGTVFNMTFEVVETGVCNLHFTSADLADDSSPAQPIPHTVKDGRFESIACEHDVAVLLEAPNHLVPRRSVNLNITVLNVGLNDEVDVELQLLIDDRLVGSTVVAYLEVNASYVLGYLWTPMVEAFYNVTAYASSVPDEDNTANNVETMEILVSYVIEVPRHFPTIQKAIDFACEGAIIQVEAGIYYEPIGIDKSLTLSGKERNTTIIDAGGYGIAVSIYANDTYISGFTIQNSWYGIRVFSAHQVTTLVEIRNNIIRYNDCGIYLANCDNCIIDGNLIVENDVVGILLEYSSCNTLCRNTICGIPTDTALLEFGIDLRYTSHSNIIKGNRISHASRGIYLRGLGSNTISRNVISDGDNGIHLHSSDSNVIKGNTISNNADYGIFMKYADSNAIWGNTLEHNGVGISMSGEDNDIYYNNFIYNFVQIYPHSGNTLHHNYWSDYVGEDLDGDGVGDTLLPHQDVDSYPLMEPWTPIPGDILLDNKVNIYDVVTACVAYGSKEGDSNWNPDADLAPPYGLINIYDIVTITFHFGETYP